MSCDESKCVSKGNSISYDGSFTCYGDGIFYPMLCADGFLPLVVEDESPLVVPDPFFGQVSLSYFTCCPPEYESFSNATDAVRHCSDPFAVDGNVDDIDEVCNDREEMYAHRQKTDGERVTSPFGHYVRKKDNHFLCCDYDQDESATPPASDYLDELDCVPYRNQWYEPARTFSIIGIIDPILCDVSGFPYPRPVGDVADSDWTGPVYQCCKEGPPLQPFVHDSAYKITVYIFVALCICAVVTSLITFVALLIPLFTQPKGTKRISSDPQSKSSSLLGGFGFISSIRSSLNKSSVSKLNLSTKNASQARSVRRGQPRYCTYNLYLVYLALLDMVYFSVQIALFVPTMNQKFYPEFYPALLLVSSGDENSFENAFDVKTGYTYQAANMWTNAIICYQIVELLKASKNLRRIQQPSVKTASLQIGITYLALFLCGLISHFLFEAALVANGNQNFERRDMLQTLNLVLLLLMVVTPSVYVVYSGVLIWWKGYIPSVKGATRKTKALRQLAFYFFRIVSVFVLIWAPNYLVLFLGLRLSKFWLFVVAYWLTAIQPILTFSLVLTKADTKKYVFDLLTLSFLFKGKCNENLKDGSQSGNQMDKRSPNDAALTGSVQSNTSVSTSRLNPPGTDCPAIESCESDESDECDEDILVSSVLGFKPKRQSLVGEETIVFDSKIVEEADGDDEECPSP